MQEMEEEIVYGARGEAIANEWNTPNFGSKVCMYYVSYSKQM
jgi:hypothetical protein